MSYLRYLCLFVCRGVECIILFVLNNCRTVVDLIVSASPELVVVPMHSII